MDQDYIKLSKEGIEAGGHRALNALHSYLAFQLVGRLVTLIFLLAVAASGYASFLPAITQILR